MDRNWNCKQRKRIRISSSNCVQQSNITMWVASSPQLAAEVIAHSLWSHQASVPCQPPKIGNSLRLAQLWVPTDTGGEQFTVLETYDHTLLHPGTRSWRNFILWLIFSLLTYQDTKNSELLWIRPKHKNSPLQSHSDGRNQVELQCLTLSARLWLSVACPRRARTWT